MPVTKSLQHPGSGAVGVLGLFLLLLPWGLPAQGGGDPEALQLLRKSEALMRGGGSAGTYRVQIVRPDWERELRLRSIDDAAHDRYRLEMLKPRKVKGTIFLKKAGKLSMYLPKLKREIGISPAMMHDPWMGSDFNNQDLMESAALIDQYEHRIKGRDGDVLSIESIPKPEAAVSWMRLEQRIRDDGVPLSIHYHCKKDARARILRFEQPRLMGGRLIPTRWIMQPLAKPDQHTLIEIEEIRFDVTPDDSLFEMETAKDKSTPSS